MLIKVTQDDVDNGIRGDLSWCPIARALRRSLNIPNDEQLEVTETSFNIKGNYIAHKSSSIEDFILNFDDGEDVQPCEFEIDEI